MCKCVAYNCGDVLPWRTNDFASFFRAIRISVACCSTVARPRRCTGVSCCPVCQRNSPASVRVYAVDEPRACGHDVCREVRKMADQGVDPMNVADKACPVVFRDPSLQQILAFEHPEAGVQLVKGGIEPGEMRAKRRCASSQEEAGIARYGASRRPRHVAIRTQRPCLVAATLHFHADAARDLDPFLRRRWRPRFQILLARRESGARREVAAAVPARTAGDPRAHTRPALARLRPNTKLASRGVSPSSSVRD